MRKYLKNYKELFKLADAIIYNPNQFSNENELRNDFGHISERKSRLFFNFSRF